MKIKMKKLCSGPQGVYHTGVEYEVSDDLGKSLVEAKAAIRLDRPKVERAIQPPIFETANSPIEEEPKKEEKPKRRRKKKE